MSSKNTFLSYFVSCCLFNSEWSTEIWLIFDVHFFMTLNMVRRKDRRKKNVQDVIQYNAIRLHILGICNNELWMAEMGERKNYVGHKNSSKNYALDRNFGILNAYAFQPSIKFSFFLKGCCRKRSLYFFLFLINELCEKNVTVAITNRQKK